MRSYVEETPTLTMKVETYWRAWIETPAGHWRPLLERWRTKERAVTEAIFLGYTVIPKAHSHEKPAPKRAKAKG